MREEFETEMIFVDENMSNSTMLIPGVSSSVDAADARIASEVIDEAGHVSSKLTTTRMTVEASANTETDHTTVQDALDCMYALEGTNISKNTLEESRVFYNKMKDAANDQAIIDKTKYYAGVADDLSSVDRKGLNYRDCEVMVVSTVRAPTLQVVCMSARMILMICAR